MSRALVCALLLAACSPATELQRKEQVIQGALDAAYLACQTGLSDPRVTWAEGARDYCLLVVQGGCHEGDARP